MSGAKEEDTLYGFIDSDAFYRICQQLIEADYDERLQMENLNPSRAKLIVISALLIKFVHKKAKAPNIVVSDHAIREGLVYELLEP